MYRCEAVSIAGFIQQLAVAYVAKGYWFYVTGCIPPHKEASAVDEKLIQRYGISVSKWTRCRRKRRGCGNVQYLRFRRFFVLLATRGEHQFFEKETCIKDVRRNPIHCFGYTVGCYRGRNGRWRASVRIEQMLLKELSQEAMSAALLEPIEALQCWFSLLPFEPYAPVCSQLLGLLAKVNRLRTAAGMELLPVWAIRLRRAPVRFHAKPCSAR